MNLSLTQDTDEKNWVSGRTEDEAKQRAAERFGVDASKISLQQGKSILYPGWC